MTRLTRMEGVGLYSSKPRLPDTLLEFIPEVHIEDMKDLLTGVLGAVLELGLPSASGPEFGSDIPLVVTAVKGDYIRIFVGPEMKFYTEKGRKFVKLTAFNYKGLPIVFDTKEWAFGPHVELEQELRKQDTLLKQISVHQKGI